MTKHTLTFREGGETSVVSVGDILCAESFGRKIVLHLCSKDREYYGKISELAKQLPDGFFQVHRCYIINMEYIICHDRERVVLSDQSVVPVSKYRYKEFEAAYVAYQQSNNESTKGGRL